MIYSFLLFFLIIILISIYLYFKVGYKGFVYHKEKKCETILHKNGVNYTGNIKDGKIHGKGNFDFDHGYKYSGVFYKGFYTSTGELILNNGQKHTFKFKKKEIIKIGIVFNDINMESVNGFFYIDKNHHLYLNDMIFSKILENCLVFDCAGNKYKGCLENGLFHGEGSLIHENGDEFRGRFENGLRFGFGRYFFKDSGYFEGNFNKNGLVGEGKYLYLKAGSPYEKYEGEIKGWTFEGKGKLYFSNGSLYKGDFKENTFYGEGTIIYENGYNYQGNFKEDCFLREGTLYKDEIEIKKFNIKKETDSIFFQTDEDNCDIILFNNGSYYKGQCENEKQNGYGEFHMSTGAYYKGDFLNGLFNGKGLYVSCYDEKFSGEFKNGEIINGEYISSNGGVYVGDFYKWNLQGEGKYILPSKTLLNGTFKEDFLNGKGKIVYFDGTVLSAEFQNGRALGEGILSANNKDYIFKIDEENCDGIVVFDDVLKDKAYLFAHDKIINLDESVDFAKEIKGRLYFFSGGVYYSSFKNQKMNGDAKVFYSNGDVYEGEIVDNFRHGYGKYYDFNGDIYEGKFKKGYYHGKGILTYNDGYRYDGEFLNGLFHGSGVYSLNNGNRYECQFKNGSPNGYGNFYYKNGNYYEGEFKDWKYSGKGNYFNACGGGYYGDFYDGFFQGNAEMIFKDGSSYCGEFLENYFYKSGVFTKDNKKYDILLNEESVDGIGFSLENDELFYIYKNGDKYKTEYSGKARIYFSNASIYEGQISLGKFNGYGELSFSYDLKIVGDFLNGNIKNGKIYDDNNFLIFQGEFNEDTSFKSGTRFYENGDVYIGEFLNALTHGHGIYKYENGDILEGEFEKGLVLNGRIEYKNGVIYEGEMENTIPHGIGKKIIYEDTVYEGSFLHGAMDGYGTIFYSNGNKFEGEFKDNHIEGKGVYFFKDNSKWEGDFKKNIDGKLVLVEGIKYNEYGEIEEEIDESILNIFGSKGE